MGDAQYLWLDLETTGLDERGCEILEVAFMLTDDRGGAVPGFEQAIIGRDLWVAPGIGSMVIRPQHLDMMCMAPEVLEMHTKSGLLAECRVTRDSVAAVGGRLCVILDQLFPDYRVTGKPILAGNSIHFDWRFLRHHMPGVVARLHYRMLDVSAVALFAEGLGIPRPEKVVAHRAADDVRASLEMFHHYRRSFFPEVEVWTQSDGTRHPLDMT